MHIIKIYVNINSPFLLLPPLSIAKTISYTGLQEAIKTMASDKFHQLVKVYMELAKKLAVAN